MGRYRDHRGTQSIDSYQSIVTEPPNPHHQTKLHALTEELIMRPPEARSGNGRSLSSDVTTVGLVEEGKNRRRRPKERYVDWERVEIDGRDTALEGANTSTTPLMPKSAPLHFLVGRTTCDMCLSAFESSSVPSTAIIIRKRVLKARRERGVPGSEGSRFLSYLYEPTRLCVSCRQFFLSKKRSHGRELELDQLDGVGRTKECASLTLESVVFKEPMDKARAMFAVTHPDCPLTGKRRQLRGTEPDEPDEHNGGNYRLDDLIEDNGCLVIEENDLARLPGATATQSSTTDHMGADVCIGLSGTHLSRVGGGPGDNCPEAIKARPTTREHGIPAPVMTITPLSIPANAASTRHDIFVDPARSKHGAAAGDRSSIDNSSEESPTSGASTVVITAAFTRICSRTRRESHPWWEVDLGGVFPVRCIRVTHPDRRSEAAETEAQPVVDVAPFWIMTTAGPIGQTTPEEARELALESKRWGSHGKVTVWDLDFNCFAAGVRIQAEGIKSLQLHRVEIIKGGGTQQAWDIVQHRLVDREPSALLLRGDSAGNFSCCPQSSAAPDVTTTPDRSKIRRVSEYTTTLRRLQHFSQERCRDATSRKPVFAPASSRAVAKSGMLISAGGDQRTGSPATALGERERTKPLTPRTIAYSTPGLGRENGESSALRPQSCPANGGGLPLGLRNGGSGSRRATSSGYRRRRRKIWMEGKEDVRGLFLRAVVGYDRIDDFKEQQMRVTGSFTDGDVAVLEDFFLRCALGDDVEARETISPANPSLQLDPEKVCGNLRRLQLQVQAKINGENKSKTPMLLAVRDSPNLFKLFTSGVVEESLPDALARAGAQLFATTGRPLRVNWNRFLGVMGLCLQIASRGTGQTLTASAVAHLFDETRSDKLDFLTRKRSRLPQPEAREVVSVGRATQHGHGRGGDGNVSGVDLPSRAAIALSALSASESWTSTQPSVDWGATGEVLSSQRGRAAASPSPAEVKRFNEAGFIDTGDESAFDTESEHTESSTNTAHLQQQHKVKRRGLPPRWGGRDTVLNSLLRPLAKHEVSLGYGEAVSQRRQRQRQALLRAPDPDPEPTRAYKPCGLCRVLFPVESLAAGTTANLKVLRAFLAAAGSPSVGRLERKASASPCGGGLLRVPLCVFCAQFFDPDSPGGIVSPDDYRLHGSGKERGGHRGGRGEDIIKRRSISANTAAANGLIPFFDDRFPDGLSDTPPPPSSAPADYAARGTSLRFRSIESACLDGARLPYRSSQGFVAESIGSNGGVHHHREAKELRAVGRLVRGGCSIRDRLRLLHTR